MARRRPLSDSPTALVPRDAVALPAAPASAHSAAPPQAEATAPEQSAEVPAAEASVAAPAAGAGHDFERIAIWPPSGSPNAPPDGPPGDGPHDGPRDGPYDTAYDGPCDDEPHEAMPGRRSTGGALLVQRDVDPNAPVPDPNALAGNISSPTADQLTGGASGGSTTSITIANTARTVSGTTLTYLWNALTNSGAREAASVLPKFTPQPQYEYDDNDRVKKVVVTVVETKEMPQWAELDAQCPPIKAEWGRYYGVLDAHENKHLAIDRKHFENVHLKAVGKAREAAWKAIDDEIDAANKENEAYDTQSNHGVNEGANINSAIQCAPEKIQSLSEAAPSQDALAASDTAPTATVQAKLAVSTPGDPFEREADAMAERVARGEPVRVAAAAAPSAVRRCAGPGACECDDCASEERKKKKKSDDAEGALAGRTVMRTADAPAGQERPGVLDASASRRVTRVVDTGSGEPLEADTRTMMESRFGHDFSRVRVHHDQEAAESAAAIQARAYAFGTHVAFAAGQYAPATDAGLRLLAHELTHVVQQGSARHLVARAPDGDKPESAGAKVARLLREALDTRTNGSRDAFLRGCIDAGGKYDEAAAAWKEDGKGVDLLSSAANLARGTADAARAYAYLRFSDLRLADKLFFAGIGAGTDKETLWRLLPAIRKALASTNADFVASYGSEGGAAFGNHYKQDAKLPDGTSNRIAGFLTEEADDEAEKVKFNALLMYGEPRPVDEIKIAMVSTHVRSGDVMAGVEKVAKNTAPDAKPDASALFKASYEQDLVDMLKVELGEKSDDFGKAKMILEGTWTPKNRILWACEGVGTNIKEIWAALGDAQRTNQMGPLKEEWDKKGEIYTAIKGETLIFDADVTRIEALLENKSDMKSRIAQLGLTIDDTKPVLKAVLEQDQVRESFKSDWPNRDGTFWKEFTQDGKRGTVWGDAIATGSFSQKLQAALDVDSEEGVLKLFSEPGRTDAERKSVRDDIEFTKRLQKLDSWSSRIELLLAPKDDLRARADYLRARFDREAMSGLGLGAASANAYAFEDEYRALDVGLNKAKDPSNLTPDERKQLDPLAKGTEDALEGFIRVRDEMDAAAVQVVGVVAGLLATVATGGAAGPMMASLIARAALAQGCASVATVWVVKGERVTGGEGMRAFAVGAAGGAVGAWVASPIMAALSPEFQAALKSGSREVAEQVAAKEFSGTGLSVLKGVAEGGVAGGAGSAVDAASQQDTWRFGFVEGLKKVLDDSLRGGLTAAAMGGGMGTVDYLKVSLFGSANAGAPAAPGSKPAAVGDPPVKVEPAHIERARIILESGGDITFERWNKEILPAFGGHETVARQALGLARRQILQSLADQLNPGLKAKGVELIVPERAGFDGRAELQLAPIDQGPAAPTDAQLNALDEAVGEVHKKLGSRENTAGVDVAEGKSRAALGVNEAEVPVTLEGESHALQARRIGERFELWLCSSHCGSIIAKIDAVLANISEAGETKSLHARLTRLRQSAIELEGKINSGEVPVRFDAEKSTKTALEEMNQIAGHLRDLSEKYPEMEDLVEFRTFNATRAMLNYDELADRHGYVRTNRRSHGQPVYQNGPNDFITPDIDAHLGGVWKRADSFANLGRKQTRMGTYDENLKRVGD